LDVELQAVVMPVV